MAMSACAKSTAFRLIFHFEHCQKYRGSLSLCLTYPCSTHQTGEEQVTWALGYLHAKYTGSRYTIIMQGPSLALQKWSLTTQDSSIIRTTIYIHSGMHSISFTHLAIFNVSNWIADLYYMCSVHDTCVFITGINSFPIIVPKKFHELVNKSSNGSTGMSASSCAFRSASDVRASIRFLYL